MTCSGCGQANPEAAQFCGGCGARLAEVCPACQTPNPPGNRFCHQCGGPLGLKAAPERDAPADQFASPSAYTPKHLAEKILTTAGAARGRRDDALGRYREGWAIIARLRAATQNPGLRAGLESSPLIREVEDLARR